MREKRSIYEAVLPTGQRSLSFRARRVWTKPFGQGRPFLNRSIRLERLCQELEDVASKLFDEVRQDTGGFSTGACTFHGKRVLMINSRQTIDERISALAREIAQHDPTRLYLKPTVRSEVERWGGDPSLLEKTPEE